MMSRIHDEIDRRPRLGGNHPPIAFTQRDRTVLNALADALIPAQDGFPAPSAVGIAEFIGRYLAPTGTDATWYPFLTGDELTSRLDAFDRPGDDPQWRAELARLQDDDPDFFATLRDLVYQGYYSHVEVIGLISAVIPAARDLHRTPQPYGYLDGLEDWDEELLTRVRGSYTGTGQVRRLTYLPE